jgi:hypothetical protein
MRSGSTGWSASGAFHDQIRLPKDRVPGLTGESAVLEFMARGELRGLVVGGKRRWLFSSRRVVELARAERQLPTAEEWFTANSQRDIF